MALPVDEKVGSIIKSLIVGSLCGFDEPTYLELVEVRVIAFSAKVVTFLS